MWNIFFSIPLVANRQSADPSNIFEPSLYNSNQNSGHEKNIGSSKNKTTDMKGECKPKKNKEIIEKSLLTYIESFIDNDPTIKLLKFMTEENGKSRKYEIEMKNLMSS